jgi:hypothetical protein
MAVISSATIITSISLFHITLAFFFLTSPESIADQTLVFILGEAMGMVDFFSIMMRLMLIVFSHMHALLMKSPNLYHSSQPSSSLLALPI